MRIFPADGGGSRAPSPEALSQQEYRSHATIEANIRFGKSAFGSTPSAMTAISNAAPTTFISTRSSMDWCHRRQHGRFPRCIDTPALVCWPGIGEAVVSPIMSISVSAEIDPDCAIGRAFAPTRWLHPGYKFLTRRSFRSGRRPTWRPGRAGPCRWGRSAHSRRRLRTNTSRRSSRPRYSASARFRFLRARCRA
jgi:hypothetical protein